MSSILKVDQLQDSGGNSIISSNGSGTFTSSLPNTGITMADQWRITADTNASTDADITTNWERADDTVWSGIGTGLTNTSGIFSFPQTGIYLILGMFSVTMTTDAGAGIRLDTTNNNSTYTADARSYVGSKEGSTVYGAVSFQFIMDVTDITTHKFKFVTTSFATSTKVKGDTNLNQSSFTVLRIGDT